MKLLQRGTTMTLCRHQVYNPHCFRHLNMSGWCGFKELIPGDVEIIKAEPRLCLGLKFIRIFGTDRLSQIAAMMRK